jgi:hypothetical protein
LTWVNPEGRIGVIRIRTVDDPASRTCGTREKDNLRHVKRFIHVLILFPGFVALNPLTLGRAEVLTQHNDNFRTGATLNEVNLKAGNINSQQFGKLYTRHVDGDIYAQPLYIEKLSIPSVGIKNVVIVATAKNNIYAFDADNYNPDPSAGLIWGPFHLGQSEQGQIDADGREPSGGCPSATYYGIISTPVIDRGRNWIYIVSKSIEADGPHHKLHRIDIRTGKGANPTPNNTPIDIQLPPELAQSYNQNVFRQQINRAGLLLSHGTVYVAFAGHCDFPYTRGSPRDSYNGWLFAFDAQTLGLVGRPLNTTPASYRGGIWQSGDGLVSCI